MSDAGACCAACQVCVLQKQSCCVFCRSQSRPCAEDVIRFFFFFFFFLSHIGHAGLHSLGIPAVRLCFPLSVMFSHALSFTLLSPADFLLTAYFACRQSGDASGNCHIKAGQAGPSCPKKKAGSTSGMADGPPAPAPAPKGPAVCTNEYSTDLWGQMALQASCIGFFLDFATLLISSSSTDTAVDVNISNHASCVLY